MVNNNDKVGIEYLEANTILNQDWQPVLYYIECKGICFRSTDEVDMKEVKAILKEDSAASATAYTQLDIPVYSSLRENPVTVKVTGENTFGQLKDEAMQQYACGESEPSNFIIKYGDMSMESKSNDLVFKFYEPSNKVVKMEMEMLQSSSEVSQPTQPVQEDSQSPDEQLDELTDKPMDKPMEKPTDKLTDKQTDE